MKSATASVALLLLLGGCRHRLDLDALPLDLIGRCKVGDRELVFVVTLDRKGVADTLRP